MYYPVMFERLFAESGLSLDRLKTFLEVAASGSITKAAGGDPVRQSQFSRQIKELEEFFRTSLIERHGKLMRLSPTGRELARISRFFLLGLSNFHSGCAGEKQLFRVAASATFTHTFLAPALAKRSVSSKRPAYISEVASEDDIERRLHDLTLDFGILTRSTLTRPLQAIDLGQSHLHLCVPKRLYPATPAALRALREQRLPLASSHEWLIHSPAPFHLPQPRVLCDSFLTAAKLLETKSVAALLPDFLHPKSSTFFTLKHPSLPPLHSRFRLAWNPRMVRLNPPTAKERDHLAQLLEKSLN